MKEIFSKARISVSQLTTDTISYLQDIYKQAGDVFTNASPYGQILNVVNQLSSFVFYFIEDSVTESNLNTATRTENIRGLIQLTGHDPSRAMAASGEIQLNFIKTPDIQGTKVIIPNYTKIKCINNNAFYILNLASDELYLDINNKTPYYSNVLNGTIEKQTKTGDGSELQSFLVYPGKGNTIDQNFINVFVNGVSWKKYDSLYDMPYNSNGCVVKNGINGGIAIYFGNGAYGAMPSNGSTILVEYLITSGLGGNLEELANIQFEFVEVGYDTLGNEVDLNSCLGVQMSKPINFGINPEPIELSKLLGPKMSRSFVLANTINYRTFLEKLNYFSSVNVFSSTDAAYIEDENVVYMLLVPNINNRLRSNDNYFTVPETYFYLTASEKEKVINSQQTVSFVIFKVVDPKISRFVINVSLIAFKGYSVETIKAKIIQTLSNYFLTLKRTQLIPKSEIISILTPIDGIDSVNINFISENDEFNALNGIKGDANIDSYGNIIIPSNDTLVLVKGGFTDRNGMYYDSSSKDNIPSAINIVVTDTKIKDY